MKNPVPFGKYLLLDRINVGGMAEVFKAKAFGVEGFERLVAVKRILPSIAEDNEFITMFVDEAKIAVQLTHANIAQIFDLGKVADAYFIALEYVSGKDLRAIFERARERGEGIPIPMACFLIMKVCEGLDYAHNKKDAAGRDLHFVHRDVSPQNVLISYDGEVKLIDFGIAKAAGKAGKTQAGILKGKFGYMSPEQVRGTPIDRRSDIFSVGIVLYELLTGERLFVGESDFATLEKVRSADIMPPSTYNRRVPEELEQIVLRALSREPNDRYATAMDLHDDLQSFMYTSGNFFARKDLGGFMRRTFAEEIAREAIKDEEFAKIQAPASVTSTGPTAAFIDLPPSRVASEVKAPSAVPAPPSRAKKTLLGMPSMGGAPSRPPVPPPPSRPPAPPPVVEEKTMIVEVPELGDSTGELNTRELEGAPTAIAMAFDEDEDLSTQIYDKPESEMTDTGMTQDQDAIATQAVPALADASPVQTSFAAAPPRTMLGMPGVSNPPPPRSAQPVRGGPSMPPPVAPRVSAPPPLGSRPPAPLRSAPPAPIVQPAPFMSPSESLPPVAAAPVSLRAPAPEAEPAPRSRTPIFLGAAALGVIAVVLVALLFSSKPASIRLTTAPVDVQVMVDGHEFAGTASPFFIGDLKPSTPHTIIVKRDGYNTWATSITLASGESQPLNVELQASAGAQPSTPPAQPAAPPPPPAPPSQPAAVATGFALDSTPSNARVFVDGAPRATTPLTVMDLAAGRHTLRIEADGYDAWETSIELAAGQMLALPRATLVAKAQPQPVAADDARTRTRVRRTTTTREPVREEPRATTPVQSQRPAGEQLAAQPVRTPAPAADSNATGTLRVNSVPWTEVFVDGERRGNTPQMNIQVRAGSHRITLVNSEFNIRDTFSVDVPAGGTTPVIRRYDTQ